MKILLAPSLAAVLALTACGDDTTAGSGGSGTSGSGGAGGSGGTTGSTTTTGSTGSGGADAYLCELSVCPAGDAQVETCPAGSTCYSLDCEPAVLCEEGGCDGVVFGSTTCELTGRRCVVPTGDCDTILRCDDADGGPEWVMDGTGPCSGG